MIRRNHDSFYGPPKGVDSSDRYAPERTATSSAYIHSTRHPTFNPSSFNSQNNNSPERGELYDPYEPGSSESESEGNEEHRNISKRGHYRHGYEGTPLSRGRHENFLWDSTYSRTGSRPDQSSHGHGPSTQPRATPGAPLFPQNVYGGRGVNGVETSSAVIPDIERATDPPPRLEVDYQHQSGFGATGGDQSNTPLKVSRKRSRGPSEVIESSPFSCDLCEVELSEAKSLEEHLECRSHWETLEHIQLQNKYDDMAIAFLQESMLHKVRKGDQVMDAGTLDSLFKKDHIRKVEMLHCGPCKVYISMSVSSLQNHINSQEHLRNKTVFKVKQKDDCLTKAKTMMKQLTHQYAKFLEGQDPFE
ncbi:DBIRD complex subunit ZNF326 [Osmerus eperlanus]|uniref:DBIRD complex subunit ZNF326 n=1 Tax=Osmerus eperlanus TaxID=29151 RepID=UPI002E0D63A1